jgi:hypothetical protein
MQAPACIQGELLQFVLHASSVNVIIATWLCKGLGTVSVTLVYPATCMQSHWP